MRDNGDDPAGPLRAAQYLRMSDSHQRYSLGNQSAAIAAYAAEHGIEIVKTYADPGRTGLTARRPGLQALLADVLAHRGEFNLILVYDVTRWGRFLNADESAHYEFACRQEGVKIRYCAEGFEGQDPISASLLKHMKRVMAADDSRKLSNNVRLAKRRAALLGFWQGGEPGYGLRRCLVDEARNPIQILQRGDAKVLKSQRVILVPGPDTELAVVARIFELFLDQDLTRTAIARRLNDEGVAYADAEDWTAAKIRTVLTNPNYVGDNVIGKTYAPLGGLPAHMPASDWIVAADAFTPLVDRELWDRARAKLAARAGNLPNEEMLDRLATLLQRDNRLSYDLIKSAAGVPHPETYISRFGSLAAAYALIGYVPTKRR